MCYLKGQIRARPSSSDAYFCYFCFQFHHEHVEELLSSASGSQFWTRHGTAYSINSLRAHASLAAIAKETLRSTMQGRCWTAQSGMV